MSLLSISNINNLSTLLLFIMIFHLALNVCHVLILMFNYLVKLESAKVWQVAWFVLFCSDPDKNASCILDMTSLPYFRVKLSCVCLIVKLREREGQGVDPGRSLKGHLWMVDSGWWYTFPWCFTLKLVATHPPTHHHPPGRLILLN